LPAYGRPSARCVLQPESSIGTARLVMRLEIRKWGTYTSVTKKLGMQMLDQYIFDLRMAGEIDPLEVCIEAHTKSNFEEFLEKPPPVQE
jgi:Tfp pilus assembly ATPase PilU